MAAPCTHRRDWYKHSTIYQIYPHSFLSTPSSSDATPSPHPSPQNVNGTLAGITSKLPYLKSLGIDIVWLSPVYASPMADMGYDISDYRQINPLYGNMQDMDALLQEAKKEGLKIVMDLVVNHTSSEHAWFQESRKGGSKRDWYVWKNGKVDRNGEGVPPNNWRSVFGGSAWTYDPSVRSYYLSCFTPSQPDLNWESPSLRAEIYAMMRFWLDKGIAGFRMDVIDMISKAPGFPDADVTVPGAWLQPAEQKFAGGPRLHEFLREMRREVLSKYDIMTVGEMPWMRHPEDVIKVVGDGRGELDMIFQFDLVTLDFGRTGRFSARSWTLQDLKATLNKWQTFMIAHRGWNSVYLENHDQPRSISRFVAREITDASDALRALAAKMLATFQAFQAGTMFVYQGAEIGMRNLPASWGVEEYRDVETRNAWREASEEEKGELMQQIRLKARDHARSPMQWDDSANAGFSKGEPWMRVNDDYKTWNVAAQEQDSGSVLNFYKRLLMTRKNWTELVVGGEFEMLGMEDEKTVVYLRTKGIEKVLVVLNFTGGEAAWEFGAEREEVRKLVKESHLISSNYSMLPELAIEGGMFLRPFEALAFGVRWRLD